MLWHEDQDVDYTRLHAAMSGTGPPCYPYDGDRDADNHRDEEMGEPVSCRPGEHVWWAVEESEPPVDRCLLCDAHRDGAPIGDARFRDIIGDHVIG